MGNLLAPDWRFFWHARVPLCHALIFGLGSMAMLSALALGVSALSSREKWTPALWFIWWILGGVLQPIAQHTQPWLRHLSFTFNLDQIASGRLPASATICKPPRTTSPLSGRCWAISRSDTMMALNHPAVGGALAALALMLRLVVVIVVKRVVPE